MEGKTPLEQALDALEGWDEAYDFIQSQLTDGRIYDSNGAPINVGMFNAAQSFGEKAIAALDAEKPAEDNYMVLLDAVFDAITENGIMNHPTKGMFLTSESIDACLPIIQQYAETYHAERCASCKERK